MVVTSSDHVLKASAAGPPANALGPADIQAAYNLPATGEGQTVAIVDADGDSRAESDLAVFRSEYGLPVCTTANGCFRKADQTGGTNYPADDVGWALETSLDLDAVSAACPKCHILLVEGDSANIADLGASVDTAVALGAKFVSNSYGTSDSGGDLRSFDQFYDHPGVAVTASSGDSGNQALWPSSSPNVTAVGGTRLTKDASTARGWIESAWAEGGSGCSMLEPKPTYQSTNGLDTGCPHRATADISADADPYSGLATYDSLNPPSATPGWMQVGGTSLASPLIASMYALAGTPQPGTYPVTYPYDPTRSSALTDVTTGTNGDCGDLLCQAGTGWDGPTGLGTPYGVTALSAGAHGSMVGLVTDTATGAPVAGAVVTTPSGYSTRTDSGGHYNLGVLTGRYDLTASAFGYLASTSTDVQVDDGQTVTVDFALAPQPLSTVTGTVTDGSGHGWPLYAKISIDGFPGGDVFTDPDTGRYTIDLPEQSNYTMHVAPVYAPGYVQQTQTVTVGASGTVTQNVSLPVDRSACLAPGYGWNGASQKFTGWTGTTAQDGWSVTGAGHTWEFDNPAYRTPPQIPDGQFAIADSNYYGTGRMNTSLVSPDVDLSHQTSPKLDFDTTYYGTAKNQNAAVDLSIDGGSTWDTIWRQTTSNALGHVSVDIPQAAGHNHVQVRFHYSASKGWWWALDNVFIGTHTCVTVAGGLLHGVVTSAGGKPVIGAVITSGDHPTEYGISVATPDDPNLPDGYYWLFSSATGSRPFTAGVDGYVSSTQTVNVTEAAITRHDWRLTARS